MGDITWQKFYDENPPPSDLQDIKTRISDFCHYHSSKNTSVVLVTSGGTTVPLEHKTVRFVDNFSAGTRGSASAEYFLKAGYAVIFMHRAKSLEPFVRHLPLTELLESFVPYRNGDGNWSIEVHGKVCDKLVHITNMYKEVLANKRLLKIQFTTLSSYLHILYETAQALKLMSKDAILYLAAAVSDFYIPQQDMVEHKISSNEGLSLNLHLVPKILQPLVRYWVPEAYVVSFKLETDESILVQRAKMALEKYGHKLVIGNELNSRKYKVIFVTKEEVDTISLTTEETETGKEIEEIIIEELLKRYNDFKCS